MRLHIAAGEQISVLVMGYVCMSLIPRAPILVGHVQTRRGSRQNVHNSATRVSDLIQSTSVNVFGLRSTNMVFTESIRGNLGALLWLCSSNLANPDSTYCCVNNQNYNDTADCCPQAGQQDDNTFHIFNNTSVVSSSPPVATSSKGSGASSTTASPPAFVTVTAIAQGLSTGAKAGIGVGIPIAVGLFAVALGLLLGQRRKRRNTSQPERDLSDKQYTPAPAEMASPPLMEMGPSFPRELDSSPTTGSNGDYRAERYNGI